MAEQTVRTVFQTIVDRQAAKIVEDTLKRHKGALEDVSQEATSVTNELKKMARENALDDISRDMAKLVREGRDADTVVENLDKHLKDLGANDKEIARVARRFNEFRNQADDFGGGSVPKSASPGGGKRLAEIGRNIRFLPSVRVPGTGIGTDTFGRGAEVLGKLGVSAGQLVSVGIPLIAVIGGLVAGLKLVSSAAEEARKAQKLYADALLEANQLLASGATTADIEKEIRKLEASGQAYRETISETQKAFDDVDINQTLGENIRKKLGDIGDDIGGFFADPFNVRGGYEEAIGQNEEALAKNEAQLRALRAELENGSAAANDAAEAEKKLAAERTASLLNEAQLAGTLETARLRAAELGIDAVEDEIDSLNDRKAALQAELNVLKQSGDTSEQVAKRIQSLTSQIDSLGKQADIFAGERGAATARTAEAERLKEAEEARKQALQDQEKALKDAERAQGQYNDRIRQARQALADANADIRLRFSDKLADIDRKFDDDLADQAVKFRQEEVREQERYHNDIARLGREARRNETDAVRNRDFAALFQSRERAAEERQELDIERKIGIQERLTDQRTENAKLFLERQRAERDADIVRQRDVRNAKIALDRQTRNAQQAYDQQLSQQAQFNNRSLQMWGNYFNQVEALQSQLSASNTTVREGGTLTRRRIGDSTVTFRELGTLLNRQASRGVIVQTTR